MAAHGVQDAAGSGSRSERMASMVLSPRLCGKRRAGSVESASPYAHRGEAAGRQSEDHGLLGFDSDCSVRHETPRGEPVSDVCWESPKFVSKTSCADARGCRIASTTDPFRIRVIRDLAGLSGPCTQFGAGT